MSDDPNDFLMSGGLPSVKYENKGDVGEGTVVRTELRQQTDPKTKSPKVWNDGKPMMQLVVTLRCPDGEERNDYFKGQKLAALRDAIRASNGERLNVNDYIKSQYYDDEATGPGLNPKKLFRCKWTAGAAAVSNWDDTPAQQQSAANLADF